MPQIIADPPSPSRYRLFSGSGIRESQGLGPDPFWLRGRGALAVAWIGSSASWAPQPIRELAADSLQIAQNEMNDSIWDCGCAAGSRGPWSRLSRRYGEEVAQGLNGRVLHDENLADAARHDEGDPAVADLFVLAHVSEEVLRRDA
jgi:hypothetical protein